MIPHYNPLLVSKDFTEFFVGRVAEYVDAEIDPHANILEVVLGGDG